MPPKAAVKPKYALTYFNIRARGELSRLMLAQAGVDYTDNRVEQDKWPALKKDAPGGTMPFLEVGGIKYGQSMAIVRYLASEFGLNGKTKLEALAIDGILCNIADVLPKTLAPLFEKDETKKAALSKTLKEETIPQLVKSIDSQIGKSGWIVGDKISAADIAVFDVLNGVVERGDDKFLAGTKVKANLDKVRAQPRIKAYLAKRPASAM